MSTTRWIRYCKPHDSLAVSPGYRCDHYRHLRATGNEGSPCGIVDRLLVDPDNLPPEAIQRAAEAVFGVRSGNRWDSVTETTRVGYRKAAEAAVTAFLSDPEPGDQT